jgi:hypothetical protein
MSDTPVDPPAGEAPADSRRSNYLGPLPVWLWVVIIVVVLVVGIIGAIALLAGNKTPSANGSPLPIESSSSPSDTPSATPTSTPTATATATDNGSVGQGTFDSDLPNFLSDTLNSQNTAVLAQGGTFSNPVFVTAANSDLQDNLTPDDAATAMDFMFTPSDPNPWDLALSDSVLAGYRAGPFGQYFPVGAIVARSHDGHVFSFIGHDSTVTTLFMASSDDDLH